MLSTSDSVAFTRSSLASFLILEISYLRDLFDFRFLPAVRFLLAVFFGTFCPAALASERPIAIACLRLVTFLPERPLFNVPSLRSRIARATFDDAFFEYFRAMIFLLVAEELIDASDQGSTIRPLGLILHWPQLRAGHETQITTSSNHEGTR